MRKSFVVLGFAALLQAVGPAEAGVRCTHQLAPVCARGPTGVRTYDNAACARVDHARILRRGICRKDIEPPAPNPYDGSHCAGDGSRPVCAEVGASRMTFPSACHARAVGATVVSWGACWYTY
jgi:hypothetical protein